MRRADPAPLVVAAVIAALLLSADVAPARLVRLWSYQELFDKSDLVVIATPVGVHDSAEQIEFPGFVGQKAVGVETTFAVAAVLKGERPAKDVVLHHYRFPEGVPHVPNGPTFISFAPAPENPAVPPRKYLLFLTREHDGRYAPVVGQTDPDPAVREIGAADPAALLNRHVAAVLQHCQAVKPGTTRAELLKTFATEGGLSTPAHRTYADPACPFIKIDVDFTPSTPGQADEKPTDVVAKVSKPYLAWGISD